MKEKTIQSKIMLHASKSGHVLFRNHVGKGITGKVVARAQSFRNLIAMINAIRDRSGRFTVVQNARETTFGLAVGSSDLIGISPVGQFVSVEVKKPGQKPSEKQKDWLAMVTRLNGLAGTATCNEDFDGIVGDEVL